MKKTTSSKKKKPEGFYAVSWAEYDKDEGELTSGIITEFTKGESVGRIYPTYEDAHSVVIKFITNEVEDYIDYCGEDEVMEKFGTTDVKEIVKMMVLRDTGGFVIMRHPERDTEYQYSIQKFIV